MNQQKQELIEKIQKPFNQIFRNKDPFGETFNDCIKQKIILCPTNGFYLNKEQFYALMKTIKKFDESSFYMALTEWDYDFPNNPTVCFDPGPWEVNSDITFEQYRSSTLVLENALFSKEGKWGILISHEDHAVLGGSNEFMQVFKNYYTSWNQDLKHFIQMCEYNQKHYKSDLTWLPDFLNYINKQK